MTEEAQRGPDELPEDLDVTVARPYKVPDIKRRRLGAYTLFGVGAACLAGGLSAGNAWLGGVAVALALTGAYWMACAWPLNLDETAALAVAAAALEYPPGHAVAQLAWRGLRSRPTWRVVMYSADEPPSLRGFVELDAVDGEVLAEHSEANPEDWTPYLKAADDTPGG